MSNVIGCNIRLMRKIRGYTRDRLADVIATETGIVYTANAIGAWERGERSPSPEIILHLCNALGCNVQNIYYPTGWKQVAINRVHDEIDKWSERSIETISYLTSTWLGNVKPLVEFCRGYAVMPPSYRLKLIRYFKFLYKDAEHAGLLSHEIDVDMGIIDDGMERLQKNNEELLRELLKEAMREE